MDSTERKRERNRLWMADYRERHRDEINARQRASYAQNSSQVLRRQKERRQRHAGTLADQRKRQPSRSAERKAAYFQKYYSRHSEKRKASSRAYYDRNGDTVRARQAAQREANRQQITARVKARYDRNPEPWKARARDRSARKRGARIGRVDYAAILNAFNGLCGICQKSLDLKAEKYHFDHIVPLAAGGPHETKNLQIAHARCNLSKGARAA